MNNHYRISFSAPLKATRSLSRLGPTRNEQLDHQAEPDHCQAGEGEVEDGPEVGEDEGGTCRDETSRKRLTQGDLLSVYKIGHVQTSTGLKLGRVFDYNRRLHLRNPKIPLYSF
jgi:hypothetical protein